MAVEKPVVPVETTGGAAAEPAFERISYDNPRLMHAHVENGVVIAPADWCADDEDE